MDVGIASPCQVSRLIVVEHYSFHRQGVLRFYCDVRIQRCHRYSEKPADFLAAVLQSLQQLYHRSAPAAYHQVCSSCRCYPMSASCRREWQFVAEGVETYLAVVFWHRRKQQRSFWSCLAVREFGF